MCYTCGCKLPYENHGEPENIVEDNLDKAGKTKAIKNDGKLSAKENLLELLRIQEEKGDLENPKEDYS